MQFVEKSFCSNNVCEDVTVCQLVNDQGEEKFYVPLNQSLNKSRELDHNQNRS